MVLITTEEYHLVNEDCCQNLQNCRLKFSRGFPSRPKRATGQRRSSSGLYTMSTSPPKRTTGPAKIVAQNSQGLTSTLKKATCQRGLLPRPLTRNAKRNLQHHWKDLWTSNIVGGVIKFIAKEFQRFKSTTE
ncbi:Uncharacterized protein APZ42_017367 [Daphnia magna]|uniref:Uncharacterized protein n=1 Tax=Daphnia magna TaxID=35525 RepID=A0A164ZU47_9CRUS|nr:Uncharacterized protein APZ42_017367 [Daphnia magna]